MHQVERSRDVVDNITDFGSTFKAHPESHNKLYTPLNHTVMAWRLMRNTIRTAMDWMWRMCSRRLKSRARCWLPEPTSETRRTKDSAWPASSSVRSSEIVHHHIIMIYRNRSQREHIHLEILVTQHRSRVGVGEQQPQSESSRQWCDPNPALPTAADIQAK